MVFGANTYQSVIDDPKELAYDLRQGFAMILINILGDVETSMQKRDYKEWFEGLDRLFIYISFKLKQDERKYYNKQLNKLNNMIYDSPEVYLNNKIEGRKIYSALKKINMWLLRKMEKYKMFGSKQDIEGLM